MTDSVKSALPPEGETLRSGAAPLRGGGVDDPAARDRPRLMEVARKFSFRNISAAYILVVLLIIFALWIPHLFYTAPDLRSILYNNAVGTLIAVGLVVPFAAGRFDASVGAMAGLASAIVAVLIANEHVPWVVAAIIVILMGAGVGLINSLVVVVFEVDSIIATLAMLSVLTGLGSWVANGQIVVGFSSSFNSFGDGSLLGISYPFWVLLAVCGLTSYVLNWTPLGRRVYATGGGEEAARLAGVNTKRIIVGSLVVSGMVAALAGIVVTARTQGGQAAVGPPYLLPAFAAAFLGATQVRPGRYNVWGTMLSSYVLAAGVQGLILAGAPQWIPDVFDGVALAIAVSLSVRRSRIRAARDARGLRRWRSRKGATAASDAEMPASRSK